MSYGQGMKMEQSELERLRVEKAQICQQLADATAALYNVASSVRDLPKLQMPVGNSEKLPPPRSSSSWVGAVSSSGKQKRRTKAAQDGA
jgi:hypothetical protein